MLWIENNYKEGKKYIYKIKAKLLNEKDWNEIMKSYQCIRGVRIMSPFLFSLKMFFSIVNTLPL